MRWLGLIAVVLGWYLILTREGRYPALKLLAALGLFAAAGLWQCTGG